MTIASGVSRQQTFIAVASILPGLGEGAEICKPLHGRDAREFLAEVVGVAAAVVRGMQKGIVS
jgi:hypothetical protein